MRAFYFIKCDTLNSMITEKRRKVRPAKRIVDVCFSSIILLLGSPFIVLILILIKSEQIYRGRPGDPLFYTEVRMSYGQKFNLYKFNIFKYEKILEEKEKGHFIHTKKFEKNNGVIKIGWLLKQIYMDELPQFYSVLKGELSIIGPRPVNLEVYKTLMDNGVTDKNRVPGGITGSYQSHKETVGASANKLDKEYADCYEGYSAAEILLLDLKIVIRTIKVILLARGI